MIESGLYKVCDNYFTDFPAEYWVDNKQENRPYYYLLKDKGGIDWLIPMSTQVENYKAKIAKEEEKRGVGNCIFYHIGFVGGRERVFLISDMFPIDESYIKSEFTIDGKHYIVKKEPLKFAIHSKAMKYLKLIETNKLVSRNNIMGIKEKLLEKQN